MLHFCSRLSYSFASAKNYTIKSLSYLIQAPPKQPISSFSVFTKVNATGKTGASASKTLKENALKWKQMKKQDKAKYQQAAASSSKAYKEVKEEYIQKYVNPFKKISGHNLYLAHLYKNKIVARPKNVSVIQYAKVVGQKLKNVPKEKMVPFEKEAEKINLERKQQVEKFKFPERLYLSQQSFSLANKEMSKQMKPLAYNNYVKEWEQNVLKWLEANDCKISLQDFLKKYNAQLKEKKTKEKENYQQNKILAQIGGKRSTRSASSKK